MSEKQISKGATLLGDLILWLIVLALISRLAYCTIEPWVQK